MMNTTAFKKACFDLVNEYDEAREKNPAIDDTVLKYDDDVLWIRFTAIGSLLDYCEKNETVSVLKYCMKDLLFTLLILNALEGGD